MVRHRSVGQQGAVKTAKIVSGGTTPHSCSSWEFRRRGRKEEEWREEDGRKRGGSEAGERRRRNRNHTEVVVKRMGTCDILSSCSRGSVSNHEATMTLSFISMRPLRRYHRVPPQSAQQNNSSTLNEIIYCNCPPKWHIYWSDDICYDLIMQWLRFG